MSDRAALPPSCAFTKPGEPLISVDSKSAWEKRAWVNKKKGPVFNLQIEPAEAWVSSLDCKNFFFKKKPNGESWNCYIESFCWHGGALSCTRENTRRKRDVTEAPRGGLSAPLSKSRETGGWGTRQGQMSVGHWFRLCWHFPWHLENIQENPKKRLGRWPRAVGKGNVWRVEWNQKSRRLREAQRSHWSAALIKEN